MNTREASKQNWVSDLSFESTNTGSLQRIADACELMAQGHAKLISDRDRYEKWWREERAKRIALEATVTGLRGQIGKQVKRARKAEGKTA